MCGISGFFNGYVDYLSDELNFKHILLNMYKSLKHRGPDASGIYLSKRCGLSHDRLSIIDIENGSQPMQKNIDGFSYTIVYNGEIYNTMELRNELLLHNITPETSSDTELLLLSFLEFGSDFIQKVNGIFSFAIYDERHETITLYRDPFGVKPLFYTSVGDTFLFGSEPKAILSYPGVKAIIEKNGLNEILSLGPARSPGCGIFKDFHEVLPGYYITVSRFGINKTCYFRLESRPHFDSYYETIEKTRFLITDSIKRQMISDVNICTFLSGGVDSSVVSAVCAAQLKEQGKTLHTFSFDFTGNNKYFRANAFQPSQDRPYVDKMTEFLDSKHEYLECTNQIQADYLFRSVDAHDFPCMADVDSSLLYFCEQVSHSEKVVLTGECADEVFGGYPWFHLEKFLNSNTFPWTPDLSFRKRLVKKELLDCLDMDEYVAAAYEKAISEIAVLPHENETQTNRRRIGYLNIRFFMQTLLNRMDRTSMYNGLEARVPFADKELVSYVFNIPWEMKAKNGLVKNVLRQAAKGLLPDEILFRQKSPYPKTYNPGYENILKTMLIDELNSAGCPLKDIVNETALNKFLSRPKDYGQPWYGQLMAGPQMIAYLLQINYFLKSRHVDVRV